MPYFTLHEVKVGNFLLTPDGAVWIVDHEEVLTNIPEVAFYYASLGPEYRMMAFQHFWQATFWNHRN